MARSSSPPRSRTKRAPRTAAPRLPAFDTAKLTAEQQAIVAAINSGPRGRFSNSGPFAVFLHAPTFGMLAQQLGGYLRFNTSLPPRLSEFAILCTGQYWKAQYEWHAHAAIAARQGVKEATIRDLAIYAFVKELYATRRVSNAAYARVHKLLGDAGMVELVGILGYYVLISMTLNVFRIPLPEGAPLPFREPSSH